MISGTPDDGNVAAVRSTQVMGGTMAGSTSEISSSSEKEDSENANGVRSEHNLNSALHNPEERLQCRCGCVPNIKSMFEMAQLREKYRAEKKKKKELEQV